MRTIAGDEYHNAFGLVLSPVLSGSRRLRAGGKTVRVKVLDAILLFIAITAQLYFLHVWIVVSLIDGNAIDGVTHAIGHRALGQSSHALSDSGCASLCEAWLCGPDCIRSAPWPSQVFVQKPSRVIVPMSSPWTQLTR